jgi:hypothetical protein
MIMIGVSRKRATTIEDVERAGLSIGARCIRHGGYERRSAERYEARVESAAKDAQREAVRVWLTAHHPLGVRMRLLSLPDERWTFENRMNDRPNTTFLGLQRDWKTLERGVPWMPIPRGFTPGSPASLACPFYATGPSGAMQGYRREKNIVLHMWAGHLLSWDNVGRKTDLDLTFRVGIKKAKGFRHVTAVWLDFTGFLVDEIVSATLGIPAFLGGGETGGMFPFVVSFLACRDAYRDHEARVAQFLVAVQQGQIRRSKWRFRFDHFEVHTGTSPFISVFGTYRNVMQSPRGREAIAPDTRDGDSVS